MSLCEALLRVLLKRVCFAARKASPASCQANQPGDVRAQPVERLPDDRTGQAHPHQPDVADGVRERRQRAEREVGQAQADHLDRVA